MLETISPEGVVGGWTKEKAGQPIFEMWLPADPDALPDVRHCILTLCKESGLCATECMDLDLALGEALANAVLHGDAQHTDAYGPNREIRVSAWHYHEYLIVEVSNRGRDFIPPEPPYRMPSPTDNAVSGRGLPLMETLTDALLIARGDAREHGCSIFLVKALRHRC